MCRCTAIKTHKKTCSVCSYENYPLGHFKGEPGYKPTFLDGISGFDMGCDEQISRYNVLTPKEKLGEIIKWLYINDGLFDNKNEWRDALIKKLEELYV